MIRKTAINALSGLAAMVASLIPVAALSDSPAKSRPEKTDKHISIVESFTLKNAAKLGIAVKPGEGTVYAAFYRSDEGLTNTYLVYSKDGLDTFSVPVRVNQNKGEAANVWYPVSLAFSPKGALYVAWATKSKDVAFPWGGVRAIRIAQSTDGGESFGPTIAPGSPPLKNGDSLDRTFVDVAVSGKGTVFLSHLALTISAENGVAKYTGQKTTQASTRVFRSLDGGKSFDEFVLDEPVCVCCHTKAVTSPTGEVYFSWRSVNLSTAKPASSTYNFENGAQNDTARDPVVARTVDGGIGNEYSKPRRISGKHWFINGCPSSGTAIGIDSRGRLHAAYFTGSSKAQAGIGYYYAYSDDKGVTFKRKPLLTDEFIPLVHQGTSLAVDKKGHVWMTFITPKLASDSQKTEETGPQAVVHVYVVDSQAKIVASKTFETDTITQPVVASNGSTTVLAFAQGEGYKIKSLSLTSEKA